MTLTRDFKQTIVERVQREPVFAAVLLDEAASLFLNGEPVTAGAILRELVNATGACRADHAAIITDTGIRGGKP